jgi:hypothetical protein
MFIMEPFVVQGGNGRDQREFTVGWTQGTLQPGEDGAGSVKSSAA